MVVSLPGCRGELWSGCGTKLAGTICSHTARVRTGQAQAPWLKRSTAQPLADEATHSHWLDAAPGGWGGWGVGGSHSKES